MKSQNSYDGDFFDAVEFGSLNDAKTYYSSDLNIDYIDSRGMSVLMIAAYYSFSEILIWILSKGSNKNLKNSEGLAAIDFARKNNHTNMEKLLSES